jgi:hypothetical protein
MQTGTARKTFFHDLTKKDDDLLARTGFSIYICSLNSEKNEKRYGSSRGHY